MNNHRELFKSPHRRTSPWKDIYRKRCFERLRASRSSLVEKFRFSGEDSTENNELNSIAEDVMEVEWQIFNQNKRFPSLGQSPESNVLNASFNSENGEFDDFTMQTLHEVLLELKSEEVAMLNDIIRFDGECLNNQVAMLTTEEVICPICQINRIEEIRSSSSSFATPPKFRKNILKCKCGLTLNRDDVSLDTVRSALQVTVSHHNHDCSGNLTFSATTDDSNGSNILITCASCDWMSFLL